MRGGHPHRGEVFLHLGEGFFRLVHFPPFRSGVETLFLEAFAQRLLAGAPVDLLQLEVRLEALVLTGNESIQGPLGAGLGLFEHPAIARHRVPGASQDDLFGLFGEVVLLIHFLQLIKLFLGIGEGLADLFDILLRAALAHGAALVFEMGEILLGLHLVTERFCQGNGSRLFRALELELGGGQLNLFSGHGELRLFDLLFEVLRLEFDEKITRLDLRAVRDRPDHGEIAPAFQVQLNRRLTGALNGAADFYLLHEILCFHRMGGCRRSCRSCRSRRGLGLFRCGFRIGGFLRLRFIFFLNLRRFGLGGGCGWFRRR